MIKIEPLTQKLDLRNVKKVNERMAKIKEEREREAEQEKEEPPKKTKHPKITA